MYEPDYNLHQSVKNRDYAATEGLLEARYNVNAAMSMATHLLHLCSTFLRL